MACHHAVGNDIAAVIIIVVGIVPVIIGSKAEPYEYLPVKPVVKSTVAKSATMKSTAVESSGREAAVKTTTTTAAAVTTAATTATGGRDGRLSQAHGCQCH